MSCSSLGIVLTVQVQSPPPILHYLDSGRGFENGGGGGVRLGQL